jgi:predicted 2-oxoglutarate/Fe(II)-dependent dioxygenase YbiX
MNKTELAPGIISYKNVINHATTLNNQIESAMTTLGFSWEPAYVKTNNETIIDTKSRDTGSLYVNSYNKKINNFLTPKDSFFSSLSNLFLEKFEPLYADYKDYYQTSTKSQESYGLLKYGVGQKFINHIDDLDNKRKISMVYYMNNNYTGGEIIFPRFKLNLKPEADEMILFPSTYVYNHSVLPVTEGTRYSVVSWLA